MTVQLTLNRSKPMWLHWQDVFFSLWLFANCRLCPIKSFIHKFKHKTYAKGSKSRYLLSIVKISEFSDECGRNSWVGRVSHCCILGNGQGNRGADGKFINSLIHRQRSCRCYVLLLWKQSSDRWVRDGHDFKNRIPVGSQWLQFSFTVRFHLNSS